MIGIPVEKVASIVQQLDEVDDTEVVTALIERKGAKALTKLPNVYICLKK